MDGIVLLAKQKGLTSFGSLSVIKKAINSNKVGHTGTLDSFAQGLLVVCTGRLTRLAGNITEFDKSYKAVIKFGAETDTLEYTGEVIETADLPSKEQVEAAVKHFTGEQLQQPPLFSAIHVDGHRASDLARKGKSAEIPSRKITVYKAELFDILLNEENKVIACGIEFTVSKGTYIRSLARDIGKFCNSAAHLVGLYRTRVGNFKIEDAAGYSLIPDFTIKDCLETAENYQINHNKDINFREHDDLLKKEIVEKIQKMNEEIAASCGYNVIHLVNDDYSANFRNGKPVLKKWFVEHTEEYQLDKLIAVFTPENEFTGLIEKIDVKHFSYKFVIN